MYLKYLSLFIIFLIHKESRLPNQRVTVKRIRLVETDRNVRQRREREEVNKNGKNSYISRYVIYGKLNKPEISLVTL